MTYGNLSLSFTDGNLSPIPLDRGLAPIAAKTEATVNQRVTIG
jgi:hypothetical protein